MKVFIIAGEPSGDALGGALMAGLKHLQPDIAFDGIGGSQMQAQGLTSRFDMAELSLMGLVEILPKYLHLKRRIRETADAIVAANPDVLITIDAPDFSLRVAKLVKHNSAIRTVHYVAPTVWAWRAKRADRMAKTIDHVLALFPFEPPFMQAAGMRCDFVGHPIATKHMPSDAAARDFRARHAPDAAPLIVVLPGSRKSEVNRLAPIFGQALDRLAGEHPGIKVIVPAARSVFELVTEATQQWPCAVTVLDGRQADAEFQKLCAFKAADVALAASGTVSLELAATQTPMVVAYDMSWLSRQIISRMLLVDTVTLVNLVSDTHVVPEFVGATCQPEMISDAITDVLATPDAQNDAMRVTMERLGRGGEDPGLRAARAVLDGFESGVAG